MPVHDAAHGGGGDATLSRSEIVVAIEALGDGEKTALAKIARFYAARTPYDHADLLQEAMCRVLGGDRKWPRDVPPVQFFHGVIRSIAWQWRQKELLVTGAPGDVQADPPQEWALFLSEFVASFADDPPAKAVLLAIIEGKKGHELVAVLEPILSNVQQAGDAAVRTVTRADLERELERVLKKIRRRVDKQRREDGPL